MSICHHSCEYSAVSASARSWGEQRHGRADHDRTSPLDDAIHTRLAAALADDRSEHTRLRRPGLRVDVYHLAAWIVHLHPYGGGICAVPKHQTPAHPGTFREHPYIWGRLYHNIGPKTARAHLPANQLAHARQRPASAD